MQLRASFLPSSLDLLLPLACLMSCSLFYCSQLRAQSLYEADATFATRALNRT